MTFKHEKKRSPPFLSHLSPHKLPYLGSILYQSIKDCSACQLELTMSDL